METLPMIDMSGDGGGGLEHFATSDIAIPFISILQDLSPQVKKGNAERIEGAEPGDIYNTVTKEVVAGAIGINVIPSAYQKRYVEWVTREKGGGFVRQHINEAILSQCNKNSKGHDELPSGNIIVPTAYYYVLILKDDGSMEKAILPMVSTQLKKSRRWNSLMASLKAKGPNGVYTPPMYGNSYQLTTSREVKDSFSWYGWEISSPTQLTNALTYNDAKALCQEIGRTEMAPQPAAITNEVM
jgi:hypothetical protein